MCAFPRAGSSGHSFQTSAWSQRPWTGHGMMTGQPRPSDKGACRFCPARPILSQRGRRGRGDAGTLFHGDPVKPCVCRRQSSDIFEP